MSNIKFTETYFCSECRSQLEFSMMDELHDGNINVYLKPCKNGCRPTSQAADGAKDLEIEVLPEGDLPPVYKLWWRRSARR